MADPHHVEPLDRFDRLTVSLYRAGLFVSALGVAALAAALVADVGEPAARWLVLLGAATAVLDLHLYDRLIRWVIAGAGWTGAVLVGLAAVLPPAAAPWAEDAGLGFLFVVLSALALKERFCFRLPIVVAVPWVLAGSLVPLRLGLHGPAAALLAVGAAILALLAVAKVRMPLHYDIGDKRRYQV